MASIFVFFPGCVTGWILSFPKFARWSPDHGTSGRGRIWRGRVSAEVIKAERGHFGTLIAQEEKIWMRTRTEGQRCEDTGRGRPSTRPGERPQEEPAPPLPGACLPASGQRTGTSVVQAPLGGGTVSGQPWETRQDQRMELKQSGEREAWPATHPLQGREGAGEMPWLLPPRGRNPIGRQPHWPRTNTPKMLAVPLRWWGVPEPLRSGPRGWRGMVE